MERRMFSVRCGLCLGAFFVATGAFALQYDVDLGFFRKDTDATRYYGTVEKVEWNGDRGMVAYASRRTFDICYDIRPCLEPIVGPKELVLESESSDAETVELSIKEFPDGKLMKFRESWTPRIVFKTALDPEKRYQIRTLRVTCKQRHSSEQGVRKIELRALSAVYDTVEAKALRVEVETGNPFHCVRDEMGCFFRVKAFAFSEDLNVQYSTSIRQRPWAGTKWPASSRFPPKREGMLSSFRLPMPTSRSVPVMIRAML